LPVPGEGPAKAKILFIGEAPGREEDLSGRPFVGRSGKFLTKLIESAGLKREKCFISSVIKHRPPKNRKPKRGEISVCFPYLESQIKIIKPRIIVLLGQTAFSAFFPKEKLKDLRGEFVTLRQAQGDKKISRDFFITYHPAAGIRFVKMKKILEKDFKKLRCL
jgi:uracil-DNA glycosylase